MSLALVASACVVAFLVQQNNLDEQQLVADLAPVATDHLNRVVEQGALTSAHLQGRRVGKAVVNQAQHQLTRLGQLAVTAKAMGCCGLVLYPTALA